MRKIFTLIAVCCLFISSFSQAQTFNKWTWQAPVIPANDLVDITFPDSLNGYAIGQGGIILKTTNGGATWAQLHYITYENINTLYFTSVQNGWVGGNNGTLYNTIDGGMHWTPFSVAHGTDVSSIVFINQDTGYVISTNGTVFKTLNAGVTWSTTNIPIQAYSTMVNACFINQDTGWIGNSYDILYKTQNGGNTWTSSGFIGITRVKFADNNIGYGIGSGFNYHDVYRTNNEAINWATVNEGTYAPKNFSVLDLILYGC